ncbi:heterokaryon incompatibility protein-domain-containing protein, partial [Leptodontidium sp. 2 PMI_412]
MRYSLLEYDALSYVWGSLKGDRQILCDDKHIFVTENCEEALRHLRLVDRSQKLWIDAICINQGSMAERNQQVNLMGDVYKLSTRTIIWLGKDNRMTRNLFWEMAVFVSRFLDIFESQWFSRVWTLQEFVLSLDPVV